VNVILRVERREGRCLGMSKIKKEKGNEEFTVSKREGNIMFT